MQFEIDSLRQRISKLEAEKTELEVKNAKLAKQVIEENVNLTQPKFLTEPETSTIFLLQDIIHDNLVEILDFVKTIYKKKISNIDKIKYSKVYSVNSILELINNQIQMIIDNIFNYNESNISQEDTSKRSKNHINGISTMARCQNHVTEILPKVSTPAKPQISNSFVKTKILSEVKTSEESISSISQFKRTLTEKQNNSAYTCVSFCRKVLDHYSDIYYKYNNKGVNYYGINAETLCLIYKLNHEDRKDVEDNYKAEFYYIKCKTSEINIIQYIGRHRDVFKYTDSEAKCPVYKDVYTRLGIWGDWSCLEIQVSVPNKIQEIKPKKFLSITEAEKKR
ncbi:hypothetical protein Glove_564g37 [Diversispora epigaea]|uniref:Uncharacterized protein n=1 Tax=Diversispora epigaea TaxID=1348612 RepID=A0A397GDK4_9GLOM|nr:hypothetical protein Glove_564g37 [Diversispora epigaea]